MYTLLLLFFVSPIPGPEVLRTSGNLFFVFDTTVVVLGLRFFRISPGKGTQRMWFLFTLNDRPLQP